MNTRSKTKRLLTPAKSARVSVSLSDSGAPAASGLGRFTNLDPIATVATDTPVAPISKSPETPRECIVEQSNVPLSSRSHASSSRSSATIKARRLSMEAQLARRSMEREQQLYERKLNHERKLLEEMQRVEKLEAEASLAAQEAEERSTRTKILCV
ncbi:uncharacterized protein [Choristoneura fumiferana]|uniref:uncharacterized protein n=1 Tax=Choristoneura fumiferana TaxID=7141 RepID=UPI003D15C79A